MVIADTNILLRCSRGKAMRRARDLIERGVTVATTESNAHELWRVLVEKLGMDEASATTEIGIVLARIQMLSWDDYGHLEAEALQRLRVGGHSDWPALAAAISLEASIWSDDVDYFGVGVPIWSTPNVHLIASERTEHA